MLGHLGITSTANRGTLHLLRDIRLRRLVPYYRKIELGKVSLETEYAITVLEQAKYPSQRYNCRIKYLKYYTNSPGQARHAAGTEKQVARQLANLELNKKRYLICYASNPLQDL